MAAGPTNSAGNQPPFVELWTGPSTITTIRTAKCRSFDSLLKSTYKEATGFRKKPRQGPVHLGRYGFESDERAYPPHQGPDRAILQYNPDHYPKWKCYLKDIKVEDDDKRNELLDVGGFGENISVRNCTDKPVMDETTMCVGDLVSFRSTEGVERARARVSGPRLPCFKINHRFGIPNMSQRTQDKGWTGWLYSVEKEGFVETGDYMVLVERPFPEWSISRVQHYCFKDPQNLVMIEEARDTLGEFLNLETKKLFEKRLTKGVEDMSLCLKGDEPEQDTINFRLRSKICETDRISEFVLERIDPVPKTSKDFMRAESGSHVRLHLKINGQTIVRPYSVVSGNSNQIRLGIALADKSRGGSAYMHKTLKVDDILQVTNVFANTFKLATENVKEHVFLAGGIGITAFLDHIRHCLDNRLSFHLHYMIRNKSDFAFKQLIEKMLVGAEETARMTVYISADGSRCNLKQSMTSIAADEQTHIYVCGNEKMADEVKANAQDLKISSARIHTEQFGIDASGDPFTVHATKSKKTVVVNNRQSLLDALREAGLEMPSSCEAGNCGTCRVRVKHGRILHKGNGLMDEEQAGYNGNEEGEMLACVSRGVGTITLEL